MLVWSRRICTARRFPVALWMSEAFVRRSECVPYSRCPAPRSKPTHRPGEHISACSGGQGSRCGSGRRSRGPCRGLRTVRLKGFPWLVFYLEFETHVDVWRMLHAKRDMPVWLSDADDWRRRHSCRCQPQIGPVEIALRSYSAKGGALRASRLPCHVHILRDLLTDQRPMERGVGVQRLARPDHVGQQHIAVDGTSYADELIPLR